ncbi:MAG: thymidine kinase [Candidatus Sumerlaeaceae bacterium]
MHIMKSKTGWIEVICGSMFSGKSEELIRRLRRAHIARQRVVAFKPRIDKRYDTGGTISSHSQQHVECIAIDDPKEIHDHLDGDTEVVGIDEVQFFGPGIVPVVEQLATRGVRVICAGLDQDYRGLPWYPMPELLARAEYIEKTLAICMVCGNPANRTQRKVLSADLVLIGSADLYEARCRGCHTVPEDEGEQASFITEENP